MGEGVGEEARLASGEPGEGDGGRGVIGVEVLEPEADCSGVALELAVTAGLASDEAGDEETEGGGVEEEDEGPKLGGVLPVLEGVEVAPGGAGAGSFATPSTGPFGVAQDRLRAGRGGGRSKRRPFDYAQGRPYGCMVAGHGSLPSTGSGRGPSTGSGQAFWWVAVPHPDGDQENKNTPEGCPLCGLRLWRRNPQLWGSCGIYPAEVNLNSRRQGGALRRCSGQARGMGGASAAPSTTLRADPTGVW